MIWIRLWILTGLVACVSACAPPTPSVPGFFGGGCRHYAKGPLGWVKVIVNMIPVCAMLGPIALAGEFTLRYKHWRLGHYHDEHEEP